jgi:DeoR/GlpR family transcriptional regulator of sugar metabolism
MDIDGDARVEGILSALEHRGQVSVTELATQFGVSAVTIRKDLEALERKALLQRVRGGARIRVSEDEGSFTERLGRAAGAKRAIARHAATFVNNGDVIALDSSTSAYFLALELLGRRDLVVVTNSLRTAMMLSEDSDATVVLLGGTVRRMATSTVGDISNVLVGRGRIAKAFTGLAALSFERGLLELSSAEAESKRAMMDASREVYALFESAKADAFGLHSFAAPDRVTRLITDTGLSDVDAALWRGIGVEVDRCRIGSSAFPSSAAPAPMADVG